MEHRQAKSESSSSSSSDDDDDSSSNNSSSYDYDDEDDSDSSIIYFSKTCTPKPIEIAKQNKTKPELKVPLKPELNIPQKTLTQKVLEMTSSERQEALLGKLVYGSDRDFKYQYNEPDEIVRQEIIKCDVMESEENIYQVIAMTKFDSEWKIYAEKKLESIIRKHPEVKYLAELDFFKLDSLQRYDKREALIVAREYKESDENEKKLIRGIDSIEDKSELWRIAQDRSNPARTYALQRYYHLPDKMTGIFGFLELILKKLF